MNKFIEFIHELMPYIHVIALVIIVCKIVAVKKYCGFQFTYFLKSFFRIYSYIDKNNTISQKRLHYMSVTNILNIFLYCWVIITIAMFLIYK